MAHAFIKPEYITGDNPVNIHIFDATQTAHGYTIKKRSHCANETRKDKATFIAQKTDKEALDYATSLKSQDKKVCGRCVGHLHKD